MQKINILGAAWSYLPLLFDICYETWGIPHFEIYKNIHDDGEPKIVNPVPEYSWNIHESGSYPDLQDGAMVLGVTSPYGKRVVFEAFAGLTQLTTAQITSLIHPKAYMALSAKALTGLLAEPGIIVSSQTNIGFGVTLKRGSAIGHHNRLGDYCEINPGVITSGYVSIGANTTIGSGTVIRDYVNIGERTIIGAGSVVVKDIPDNVIAYGNPCNIAGENTQWKR